MFRCEKVSEGVVIAATVRAPASRARSSLGVWETVGGAAERGAQVPCALQSPCFHRVLTQEQGQAVLCRGVAAHLLMQGSQSLLVKTLSGLLYTVVPPAHVGHQNWIIDPGQSSDAAKHFGAISERGRPLRRDERSCFNT